MFAIGTTKKGVNSKYAVAIIFAHYPDFIVNKLNMYDLVINLFFI